MSYARGRCTACSTFYDSEDVGCKVCALARRQFEVVEEKAGLSRLAENTVTALNEQLDLLGVKLRESDEYDRTLVKELNFIAKSVALVTESTRKLLETETENYNNLSKRERMDLVKDFVRSLPARDRHDLQMDIGRIIAGEDLQ